MRLAVELYGVVIGTLTGDARSFDFVPSADGIARFGAGSPVLSVAVPLVAGARRDLAARRRNWFAELLPEGSQYEAMLEHGGLRRGDTPGFLARFGRDVAGALQIWDLDDPTEPRTPSVRPLSSAQVRRLLEDPLGSPLANDPAAGRSSLGGVQPKVVLVRGADGWAQGMGGEPTTHLLKPQLGGAHASVIFDEEHGTRLARRIGLLSHASSIEVFDGLPALVIERFDRSDGARLHQEDFNQALGASGNEKYQELGGVVSLRRVADTLRRVAPESDLSRLARMVVLAVAIGNLDMHTKNLGLLHPEDGSVALAPAYDVVPQAHLATDGRMALAVAGQYRHAAIGREDLLREFASWRLRRAAPTIDDTLAELQEVVAAESPHPDATPQLQEQILGFIERLRAGRPAGAPGD